MISKVLSSEAQRKAECARQYFRAISNNGYIYNVAKGYRSLYDIVTK